MRAHRADRTRVPTAQVNLQVTIIGLGQLARTQGPVTHRHTVSVKHRLVLWLLQLWANGKLLAATMHILVVEQEPTSVRAAHCVVPREGGNGSTAR